MSMGFIGILAPALTAWCTLTTLYMPHNLTIMVVYLVFCVFLYFTFFKIIPYQKQYFRQEIHFQLPPQPLLHVASSGMCIYIMSSNVVPFYVPFLVSSSRIIGV